MGSFCHCGCAIDAHFKDQKGMGACLVMRCDCSSYRDVTKPNPIRPVRPKHHRDCRCLGCKAAAAPALTDEDVDATVTPLLPPPFFFPGWP